MIGGHVETVADEDGPGSKFISDPLPTVKGTSHSSTLDHPAAHEDNDDGIVGAGRRGAGVVQDILRQSSHRTTASFHVGLKLAAVASYLLIGFFTSSFVVQFVVTVTLLAVDFWTVKNVSGRLLVGLRWWNEIAEDGITQIWRFESLPDRSQLNVIDGRIFWWTLYATPAVWLLLGVVCILKFNLSYLVIVIVAIVLSVANIIGYYKCDKEATEQMRRFIGKSVLGHALEQSGLGSLSRFIP